MESANQWLGRYGEDRALEYLRGIGYEIIEPMATGSMISRHN